MSIKREAESSNYLYTLDSSFEANSFVRIKSEDLFQQKREIEIEHAGRIYRLQLTNSNKLILTA